MKSHTKKLIAATTLALASSLSIAQGTTEKPCHSQTQTSAFESIRVMLELKQKAMQGDADKQARLGLALMQKGQYAEAILWNNIASLNGSKLGHLNMAKHYKYGLAVRKNDEKSKRFQDKASSSV